MKTRLDLQRTGGNTTGFEVPEDFVAALGGGGRPKVVVQLNGLTFRTTIAKMGGSFWLGVSAERRAAAGVEGGQTYDLDIALDTQPRVIEVPADLQAALDAEPAVGDFWKTVAYSNQRWHVEQLTSAKTDETRSRRLAKSLGLLRAGRAR